MSKTHFKADIVIGFYSSIFLQLYLADIDGAVSLANEKYLEEKVFLS